MMFNLAMKKILENLNLEQYIQVFEDEGIEDVTTFNDYEDSDLEELGLKKPHIKRLRRYFEEQTKEIIPLQEETLWYQVLKNDKTIWNEKILSSNIPIVSHEYNRIYNLLENGQYFGVLLQIKDFFEILLKLPVLIVLNEKFNLKEYTQSEMNFILATLEKPLSLGHWHELATFIKKYTLDDSVLSELISNTIKLYNKHDIIKWRNDEIGHGALSLDDDIEFQKDIKSKLFLLKNFLDDNSNILISIYFDFDNNQVVYGTKKCSFIPFLKNLENKIYFFDSYLSRKQKVHQLNYCFGKKLISEVPDFDDFISKYEITKREQQLSSCKIEDVRIAEEEKQLDLLESSTDFISPTHLVTWLDNSMKNFQKGKFLLQMQRGTGKSIFCKALDQLALNKIDFKDDIIVRGFYINDVFRNTLSDFTSEVSYFILNKKLDGKSFVDVFKGNLPNLNQDSTKSDFAYLLNWYKQKYDVEKLLFIIDGVDEIPQQSNKAIFDILPDEHELDEGVFLLITSRTDEEIITYTKEQLAKLEFQDKKIIKKNSKENIETLKSYISKFKLVADDSQIEDLIQKADYRILYLNMLKDILLSCKINFEDIPSNEYIIDFYLLEIKKKYGEKYFQTIFDILIILASQLEELTIKEMALLNNDSGVSLKLLASIFDIRGFIKKTRNFRGSLLSLNHISLVEYFNKTYLEEIKLLVSNLYKEIEKAYHDDEADIYKMAYLQYYENIYNLNLSSNLDSKKILEFILKTTNTDGRIIKITTFLINKLIKQGDIKLMADYLKQLDKMILQNSIETKMNDDNFIHFIVNNIESLLKEYDISKYNLFKVLYINFYKYSDKNIAFKIIDFLILKDEKFDDILNYISMCKGDSKWDKASIMINQYLNSNDFKELQLAQFYYILGRMYVDDINNFSKSKMYLEQSIKLYIENNQNINANIVINTLSMYYFSNGEYERAYDILLPIYNQVMDDNGIVYDQNATEAIYNNMYIYCIINKKPIPKEKINFLNKEIELYYKNTLAIEYLTKHNLEESKSIFIDSILNADIFCKRYVKAALIYNYSISFDENKISEAKDIINTNGYSIGKFIVDNNQSSKHVLNTYKINNKNYWFCLKNVDLLV